MVKINVIGLDELKEKLQGKSPEEIVSEFINSTTRKSDLMEDIELGLGDKLVFDDVSYILHEIIEEDGRIKVKLVPEIKLFLARTYGTVPNTYEDTFREVSKRFNVDYDDLLEFIAKGGYGGGDDL